MNIILVGYRGSGKTTLGKLLANRQWMTFVDTDHETRKRFGNKSITEIWESQGEQEWRRAEVAVAEELCRRDGLVIALGGGTLMEPGARRAVLDSEQAVKVYLYCQPEELHRRITEDSQSSVMRPNLTDLAGGIEEIETILAQRDHIYRAVSDKLLDVTHLTPENAVRYLIEKCL